jgi:purine-binding chemotaxis protein CheW
MEQTDLQKNKDNAGIVSPEIMKAVIFSLSGHEHAVDVRQVKEILINTPVSPVIEAPDFVEGVIRLRGRIVPIIDLSRRLKLSATARTIKTCIIVVRCESNVAGFIVDSASEILKIPLEKIEAPTDIVGGINIEFIKGVVYLDNRFLVILNLNTVLKVSETELAELRAQATEPENRSDSRREELYA